MLALLAGACSSPRSDSSSTSEAPSRRSQALQSSISTLDFVVLAEQSFVVGQFTRTRGGMLGARGVGATPSLVPGFEASLDQHADTGTWAVLGDSLKLGHFAVAGELSTNDLLDQGGTHGPVGAFLLPPSLPAVSPVAAGVVPLTVAKKTTQTLVASQRGAVQVEQQATLRLSGGLYQFASLTLGPQARLEVLAPSEVRIADRIDTGTKAFLGPVVMGLSAKDLRLEVGGTNGGSADPQAGPPAVSFAENNEIRALMLVPNGTLRVLNHSALKGAFFGRNVELKEHINAAFEDGFIGDPICAGGCNDGNPCTIDYCNAGQCTYTPVTEGTSCSDGNACNGAEICNAVGGCLPGTPPVVDDSNACTTDSCDPLLGVVHAPSPVGSPCGDDNACNGIETCNGAGICAGGPAPVVEDNNPCTIDSCDPVTGVAHTPAAAGTPCSDSNACNGLETCNAAGSCQSGSPLVVDDNNPCTIDSCNSTTGVAHVPVVVGTSCSDGNACNGLETCDAAGACLPGSAPALDDGNPCTADSCQPATGVAHTPVAVGTPCSDGNACNGLETCDGAALCAAGQPPATEDGNPCTVDTCDPLTGVLHVPAAAGVPCSDGNACNGLEACNGTGACSAGTPPSVDDGNPCTTDSCHPASGVVHAPIAAGTPCSDGDACNGLEACNGAGVCSAGIAPTVDDGNPCTADSCHPATGVAHSAVAAGTPCSDGNACNGAEVCNAAGVCQGGSPPALDDGNPCTADTCDPEAGVTHLAIAAGTSCSDGNACNGLEICDVSGHCAGGSAPVVEDNNPCTIDSCDPVTGVAHTPMAAGTPCSDSNACNGLETCDAAGACQPGAPLSTNDNNPCTVDSCNPTTGVIHTPATAGTSCSDGNACNGLETCDAAGACQPGSVPSLNDGNPCTTDSCDPTTGVAHTPVTEGTSCSDANACNGLEACDAAGACQPGSPPSIDDGNPCTADSCDPATGVAHVPVAVGTSCSDGNACNGLETCNGAGVCSAGIAPNVDDGNPCTSDSCDPAGGVIHTPATAGTPCSDGNACNGLETCNAAGSCQSGSPLVVDDNNPCTTDSCNPTTGVAHAPVALGTSCSDGNACNGLETCDAAGACLPGSSPAIDDGNPCTTDSCDPAEGVRHVAVTNGTSCNDNNACTQMDTCQAGICSGSNPVVCPGADACHGAGTCDPASGTCARPVLAGASCNDGNACTYADTCDLSGSCAGTPLSCVSDACTTRSCQGTDTCAVQFASAGTSCSGDPCIVGQNVCNGGGACGCSASLPPDPALIAPPLDRTVGTTLGSAASFLYTGTNPVQTGVNAQAIDPVRAAICRGRVVDASGQPLPGVRVRVQGRPELGQTYSRLDGAFDLVVHSGGDVLFEFDRPGYITASRSVPTTPQLYCSVPLVAMVQPDSQGTVVTLNGSGGSQLAQSSTITDTSGTRSAVMILPAGVVGTMVMPDGSTRPLSSATLRMTEFTVGDMGPDRMPAPLPPQSAYTYAAELSLDEALAAGAASVQFSSPLSLYVDNFLGFPVGGLVPNAFFDRAGLSPCCTSVACWVPQPDGRVIKILSVVNGTVTIDVTGDGIADNPVALGFSADELAQLASLYTAGKTLWRIPVSHFSPLDANWPSFASIGAGGTNATLPSVGGKFTGGTGDFIGCRGQDVGKTLPLQGTSLCLDYQSSRQEGQIDGYTLTIPLSGPTLPSTPPKRIDLVVEVAGRTFSQSFAPTPNLSTTFTWDGLDAYGRRLQGTQPVRATIRFVYDAFYEAPAAGVGSSFGAVSGNGFAFGVPARDELSIDRTWQGQFSEWDAAPQGLGGWSLCGHHALDLVGSNLYEGDGSQRNAEALPPVLRWFAGSAGAVSNVVPVGQPVKEYGLSPHTIGTAPDGTVYIAHYSCLLSKVTTDGRIRHVAGLPFQCGYSGDGGPSTQAKIGTIRSIAVAADGSVLFADDTLRIRKITPDGIIDTIAGTGIVNGQATCPPAGINGPAKSAAFCGLNDIALGSDCSIYATGNDHVFRIGADGILRYFAGAYGRNSSAIPPTGPALNASFSSNIRQVAVGPDGSVYIGNAFVGKVYRVTPDGIIRHIAGQDNANNTTDGGLAINAYFHGIYDLAVDKNGVLYVSDDFYRAWAIPQDGTIRRVAGTGQASFLNVDGTPARGTDLAATSLAIGPNNLLYIASNAGAAQRVYQLAPPLPQVSSSSQSVAGASGQELHLFDPLGRHIQSIDARTGGILRQFQYDAAGRVLSVTDGNGLATTIVRDAQGNPTAIVAPSGETTQILLDAQNRLASVVDPDGNARSFTYSPGGLMLSATDPSGAAETFLYDASGRLISATDDAGSTTTLASNSNATSLTVNRATQLGRASSISTQNTTTGDRVVTAQSPASGSTVRIEGADGSRKVTLPSGTISTEVFAGDPRFGMQAPYLSSLSIRNPSGLQLTQTRTRTTTLASSTNPLSITQQNDSVVINSRSFSTVWNRAARTVVSTSPLGRQVTLSLDASNRFSGVTLPGLTPLTVSYDSQGRVISSAQGANSYARSYDTRGNLASISNAEGESLHFAGYQGPGKPSLIQLPGGPSLALGYDHDGNVTSLVPPGKPGHQMGYTAFGTLLGYAPAGAAGAVNYTYNPDRQLVQVTRLDGAIIQLNYTAGGALQSIVQPSGTTSFAFSPTTKKLTSITAPDGGSLSYTYDGELLLSSAWGGVVAGTVTRGYDSFFRVTTENVSGQSISFGYDNDGLMTSAGAMTLTYHPQHGLLTGTALGTTSETLGYDSFGAIASHQVTSGGSPVFSAVHTRNTLGKITQITENSAGVARVVGYDYDPAGRLISVTVGGALAASYGYDDNGNRILISDAGGAASASFDGQDRLLSQGTATFAHSLDGERTGRTDALGTTSYSHDALGNLRSVTLPDATVVSYVLDGKGRRIGKKVNGVLVQGFLYSDPGRVVAELDGAGNVVRRFVYAANRPTPDFMIQAGVAYRIISDATGSPRLVVNTSTGAVVQRLDYDPFGAVLTDSNPGAQPFGFAGGLLDAHTGLLHLGARDLDPATGRFLLRDPLGFRGGDSNLYVFSFNDPVNLLALVGVGGLERVGGFPFSVGRLASFGYRQFRAWKTSGAMLGSFGPRAGGALDLELVNLSGEPVGLAPYSALGARSETCTPVELDDALTSKQWVGFRTCDACTFADDLIARALLPIPAAASISTLPPCQAGTTSAGGATAAPPGATGGVSLAQVATASPAVVTGLSTSLRALGSDTAAAGEAGLTYTWASLGAPPAAVAFSVNGTNAAKNTTATFTKAGEYALQVTVRNGANQTTASTVNLRVEATATSASIAPAQATVSLTGSQAFTASVLDQFGQPLSLQPELTWSVSGGGTISPAGFFTSAGVPGGPHSVLAFNDSVGAQASVSVSKALPLIVAGPTATPPVVTGTTTQLDVLGAIEGSEASLSYGWFANGPYGVKITPNGTNDAKHALAKFIAVGTYPIDVVVHDLYGGTAQSSVTVEVLPTLSSLALSPQSVTVDAGGTQAFYPLGIDQFQQDVLPTSVQWSVNGGGSIDAAGLLHADPVVGGPFIVTATVGARTATATFSIGNLPPSVISPPSAANNPLRGLSTALSVLGNSSAGEASLLYGWQSLAGPAPVSFSASGSNDAKNAVATFAASGTYQLQSTITDPAGQVTSRLLGLTVEPVVFSVAATPPSATGEAGEKLGFAAAAVDQFGHQVTDAVAFAWTQVSGPGSTTFFAPSSASTSASFPAVGAYLLRVSATGGGSTRSVDVPVTITAANQPPVIAMGPGSSLQLPASSASLTASVTDDGLPASATLTQRWSLLSGPAGVTFSHPTAASTSVSFVAPGSYVLQLTASDGKLSSSKTVSVEVSPIQGAKPVVALTGPTDGDEITAPTAITGTISQGSWKLEYRRGGDGEGGWVPFASGTGPASGTLATFDPTLLQNGTYALRLSASTSGGSSSVDLSASVTRNMKVGHFSLAFTDLQIPLSGLPITLVRTYDSRDKESGDFGHGWRLDIKNVRVEESRPVGRAWNQDPDNAFFPTYTLLPHKSHELTVTFGGSKVYRFRAKPTPSSSFLQPIPSGQMEYEAVAPTLGKIHPLDDNDFIVRPGNPGSLLNYELEELKLNRFLLTTEDGTEWVVSKDKGVESMKDRVGNTLTVDDLGIHHSSGESVSFERDSKGRITKITDPAGRSMFYTYDVFGDLVSFADRENAKQRFEYQQDHLLLDYTDANGHRAVRNDYDAQGRLQSQTDAKGKTVTFGHNLNARVEQVTNRLGETTTFEYDDRGNVTRVTDALGHSKQMAYDLRDNKLSETDELGHTTTYTYDVNDNETSRTDALGHVWSKTWNPFRQVLTETDPLGHTTTNVIDDLNGLLYSTTDALGHKTEHFYSAITGLRFKTKDALGHETHFAYDSKGRTTQMTDALGHVTAYTYDSNGNKLTESTTRTHLGQVQPVVTTYEYDKNDRVVRTVMPDGSAARTEYSPTGKRVKSIDELGRVTSYGYDALEQLVLTTYPDGTTSSSSYDDEGRAVSRTDQAGRVTTMGYDAVGRLTTTTHPDGATSSRSYDDAGRVVAQTNENGHTTLFVYDNAGRRTSAIDALGHASTMAYDAAGRQVSSTDALGHTTTSTYDAVGRMTVSTFADGSTQQRQHDALGRVVAMVDELGRTTTQRQYDALGRLEAVTDALNHTTSYGYDELGRLVSQTDANGHTTTFAFDLRGRQIARTLPDGATEAKSYDAAGNALTRTDFAGRTTAYSYDAMNRLLSRSYPDGSSVSFAYTPTGRRASFSDSRGTTTYGYDARDRVTLLTYPDGRCLTYGYDALGHRTALTANVGGQSLTTTYGYDDDERPSSVSDPLGGAYAISYDDAGRMVSMSYPNGTATAYGYDVRNRSTSIVTTGPGGSSIQSYALTLDAAGRRTAIAEGDGAHKVYGYDSVDRLVSESVAGGVGPSYSKTFSYDSVGNRLQQDTTGSGAGSVFYSYDSRDRLTSEGPATYSFDTNGNVISKSGESTYTWDFDNRLVRVEMASGAKVDHTYDPEGHRVSSTSTPVGGVATKTDFLVDSTGQFSHVVVDSQGGVLTVAYVRIGDELLAALRPDVFGGWTMRFVHHDALNSIRVLSNETAAVVDSKTYEAFGARLLGGSDSLVYGFAGEPFDDLSNLGYHRARWFLASTGRFISADPYVGNILLPFSLHDYIYGEDNPLGKVDPSGEMSISAGVVGAVGIFASLAYVGHSWYQNYQIGKGAPLNLVGVSTWSKGQPGSKRFLEEGADYNRSKGSSLFWFFSVDDFVESIEQKLGKNRFFDPSGKIQSLTIVAHGFTYPNVGIRFGHNPVSQDTFWNYSNTFGGIKEYFSPSASVEFQSCFAGKSSSLINNFKHVWGVQDIKAYPNYVCYDKGNFVENCSDE